MTYKFIEKINTFIHQSAQRLDELLDSPSRQIVVCLLVNLLLRLPGVLHELPPNTFCDEDRFTLGSYKMFETLTWKTPLFQADGLNYYLPLVVARLFRAVFQTGFTPTAYILLSRFLSCFLLSSLSVAFVYRTLAILSQGNKAIALLGMWTMTLSPMVLGISRIHYPDHYVVFFAAGTLWAFCHMWQAYRWRDYVFAGLFIGLAVSVKYSALIFIPFYFLAHGIGRLEQRQFWKLFFSLRLAAGFAAGIAIFILCNPFILSDWNHFLSGYRFNFLHYESGREGLEAIDPAFFYFKVLYLTSFGLTGIALYAVGLLPLIRRSFFRGLFFFLFPCCLVVILSQHKVVLNRNVSLAWPFMFSMIGMGFYTALTWIQRTAKNRAGSYAPAILLSFVVLFTVEPLFKTFYSYYYDFKKESQTAARQWIYRHLNWRAQIGYSQAGWGLAIDDTKYKVKRFLMPVPLSEAPDLDYYIMDSWFYDHWGLSKELLAEPVYYEHIYLNTGSRPYPFTRKQQDLFLSQFVLIKRFGKPEYYGPDVFIYKNRSKFGQWQENLDETAAGYTLL